MTRMAPPGSYSCSVSCSSCGFVVCIVGSCLHTFEIIHTPWVALLGLTLAVCVAAAVAPAPALEGKELETVRALSLVLGGSPASQNGQRPAPHKVR